MKKHESKYNPAVKELSDFVIKQARDGGIRPDMITKITSVLDGVERMDEMISQKEQLLVQQEKELVRLKSITDNSSKVARNIINESKGNLDKAIDLLNSRKFSEALKYSDIALYNVEDIDNLGLQTLAQANNLYLERNQQYVESAAKRDYFYNQGIINGVNAFSWVKDNPTRDFYSFFRDTLKVSDKSPENVNLIQNRLYKNLPKYLEEAHRANSFYSEYNKYYDVKTKLEQVINIHNIRAASSKGLKDYEEALKSCEIALEIDPTSATLLNLKNAVLQEKQIVEARKLEEEQLLVSQTQEIERLRELLSIKEVEAQEKDALLLAKELEKQESLIQKEREKEELLVLKENELREKEELLVQKGLEINNLANSLLTKEEEIVSKDLKIGEVSQKVKKVTRKLAAKDNLLSDKEQRIEELKALIEQSKIEKEELLAQQETLLANKSHMKNQIIDALEEEVNLKENEVVNLRIQNLEKELKTQEQEKLLIQKELELADKSFVKNQVIEETEKLLSEQDIRLQNILDLNAKLDAKMQYSAKEIKIREAEKEILSKIVNQKNDQLKYLLIEKENAVDNKSFEKNQVIKQLREEIIDLNKQLLEHDQHITHSVFLDEVGCQPGSSLFEKQLLESLNLSSINLSPINHGEQNQIVGNILGNFDIENQHITHSVTLGGEVSQSFEIIQQESFN
jgi:hypothetical protein